MNIVHKSILLWYTSFSLFIGIVFLINPYGAYDIKNTGMFLVGSGVLHLMSLFKPKI